jgi:hypothetical protein
MCSCPLRYSLVLGREEEEETEMKTNVCGGRFQYSMELGKEEEETEMKTTVWLSSSILSGIGKRGGGDGNEDDCVVVLFDTL